MNLGLGHCAQSVILAIQEIGDRTHTGQRLCCPSFLDKRLVHGLGRHVGVQQGGAQTRLGFAVRLHDGLDFSQQLWVFVFRFGLDSRAEMSLMQVMPV